MSINSEMHTSAKEANARLKNNELKPNTLEWVIAIACMATNGFVNADTSDPHTHAQLLELRNDIRQGLKREQYYELYCLFKPELTDYKAEALEVMSNEKWQKRFYQEILETMDEILPA